ncbi:MAG TPA: MoxR family ATPase [Flavobacterium sp.]|nr:MoxR family ATPase [Flavobacterium sp.]
MTENQNPENENLSFENRIDLSNLKEKTNLIKQEIGKVIVGQEQMIELLLVGLLSKGHVLIEGVPGVAKTITAKLLAKTINTGFSRIQFTPDLMPSDILGTSVYNNKINDFEFKSGPIFSNFILIDEINRAPAKTQAALFEVMEERQVTIDAQRYAMKEPFVVIATQNPIEQEGTYQLPEAQLDRFLFKITVDYPTLEQEISILTKEHELLDNDKIADVQAVISESEIVEFQKVVKHILIENHLIAYIANIVNATRNNPLLFMGASPRASIALLNAAKSFAAISGRDFVTPDDIQTVSVPVLQHRIIVSPDKEMEGVTSREIINQIVQSIEIPR